MDEQHKMKFRRRDFIAVLTTGGLAAAATSMALRDVNARAATESYDEQRKPRYQESEEVKTFYRVNFYPAREKRSC
jgi:hypothetical protein